MSSNLGREPDPVDRALPRGAGYGIPEIAETVLNPGMFSITITSTMTILISSRFRGKVLRMRPAFTTTCLIEDSREVRRYDLGGHTHYKLDCHFVWRTKFNRRILGPLLTPFLVREIESICIAKKVKQLGLALAVNHVHFCARLRRSQSPAQVMRWIKLTTSKRAFECYPELETRYGLRRLWGRGYHVESLGDQNVFAILAYIGRQDEKHDLRELEASLVDVDAFLGRIDGDDDDAEDKDE